jgi:predicted deacylase
MARSRSRLTAEIDFDRDGKQHGFIRLPYSVHRSAYGWIPIPVACIKNGDGPRVLLMAGNHGDEYEGQVALGKLIRSLEAEEVCGRIIILPSANFPAAMAGMRTSPLDEGNLNRSFPGDPYGGPTAQIADYIESVLLPQCDFVFDFHSGGSSLTYVPSALMRRPQTPETLAQGIEMLRTFGAPVAYLVDAALGDHTLTAAAARAEVRHMSTEIAGGGQVTPTALRIMESGIRRVLAKVGGAERRAAAGRGRDSDHAGARPGLLRLCPRPRAFRAPRRTGRRGNRGHPGRDHPSARHAVARARHRRLRPRRHRYLQARPRPRRAGRLPLSPCGRFRAVSRATYRTVGTCIRHGRGGPSGLTADQVPILDIEALPYRQSARVVHAKSRYA